MSVKINSVHHVSVSYRLYGLLVVEYNEDDVLTLTATSAHSASDAAAKISYALNGLLQQARTVIDGEVESDGA